MSDPNKLPVAEMNRIRERLTKLRVDFNCRICNGEMIIDNELRALSSVNFEQREIDVDKGTPVIRLICFDCSNLLLFDYTAIMTDDKSAFYICK